MKQEVIVQLSNADLLERIEEEKKQMTRLRLNHAVSPLDNPHKLREYRKIIARLQTEIRRRQLEGSM
ncbi:MAG TPA: 50S ribosomal protein L29 [Bacteroidales bacterium]|nr:50S ribosomal protein L29 [Lentimicrobiaceae bacterium]HOH99926.1 50S ribosomal protein L29 [Bacteroidales bacterium]